MLKVVKKSMGIGVAIAGISLQCPIDDLLELWRDRWICDAGRNGVIQEPVVHGRDGSGAREGQLSGEHLVENDADGIDVGAAITAFAFDLLGGDVVWRAESGGEVGVGETAGR